MPKSTPETPKSPASGSSASGQSSASGSGQSPGSSRTVLGLLRVCETLFALDNTMPVSQATILFAIAARGPKNPMTIGEIAQRLELHESRVSRNVVLLEDLGLVGKKRDPLDVRSKYALLTTKGEAFVSRLSHLMEA